MAEAAGYWAFISYSHRDAGTAARAQRWLETYRIPPWLAGSRAAGGEIPLHLKPVFRDRDELQAGADLRSTVREALGRSRYLIVVCSPDAARSAWVSQEIVEFKQLHGESRVLALIAAGEPFASRMPGREEEECFPAALRFALAPDGEPRGAALEPIAADLRPQGDGERLAMLKLVAGMIGVGVDELVRRDAQRRARRMALVAGASVAGMVVMAMLTANAVQSRNEAHRQRGHAEDLIEFMLGDLRQKLVPVGRLDVLDAVGAKALGYYAQQASDSLDANALGRRSRALHLIGEMREQRGQLEEALAAYGSAADTTAVLLQRFPGDGQRIFDHAQSVYWVGHVAWRRGQAQSAETSFLQYRALAQELIGIDSHNVDWQLETAYANHNLGVVQLKRRNLDAALRSFSAARDTLGSFVIQRPSVANELAEAHGWIAKVSEAAGDFEAGIESQQRRLEVLRAMPNAATDRRIQHQIANVSFALGRLRFDMGQAARAEADMRAAVEAMQALVASDAANMWWYSELCFYRLRWVEIERALGKLESARAHLDLTATEAARLLQGDATSLQWQISLKGLLLAQQAALAMAQRRNPPLQALEDFVATARRMEAAGKVFDSDQAEIVATVELMLGDALHREGRRDAAVEHWKAIVARFQPQAENAGYPVLALLARTYLRLEQATQARVLIARIEASKYRHPAYADLVHEARHGTRPGRTNRRRR